MKKTYTHTLKAQLAQVLAAPATPFDVYDTAGKRLGQAESFNTAMIMHLKAIRESKRPELHERYAGVCTTNENFGHPLFFLEN